jgi:hypothetical protein
MSPSLCHAMWITDFAKYLYRFCTRDIQYLIRLTGNFTWEELPTRHPTTGHLTKAGYIPKIQTIAKYIVVVALVFNGLQGIVHMASTHDMMYTQWYPFDASVSPAYELVNLSQVILKPYPIHYSNFRKTYFMHIQVVRNPKWNENWKSSFCRKHPSLSDSKIVLFCLHPYRKIYCL